MIVRETNAEAWKAADELIQHVTDETWIRGLSDPDDATWRAHMLEWGATEVPLTLADLRKLFADELQGGADDRVVAHAGELQEQRQWSRDRRSGAR